LGLFDSDWIVAVFCVLVAAGLCAYRLTLHNVLFGVHGSADGVFLGSALQLVHGVKPYKDYAYTYLPGGTLLLAPLALLGRVIGAPDAMAAARCLTSLAVAINAGLAAWCLHVRGRAAMLVAGLGLALFPLSISGAQSVSLEPFAALLCLIGILVIFAGETAPTRGRLTGGGVAFGLAGTIVIWAIVPMVVALLFVLAILRSARFTVALALGFVLPIAPLAGYAPHAFFHEVFGVQLGTGSAFAMVAVKARLLTTTGLGGFTAFHAGANVAVAVMAAFAALVVAAFVAGRHDLGLMEWYVLVATALVVAELLLVPQYFANYSYFSGVFLALLAGACVGSVAYGLDSWFARKTAAEAGAGSAAIIGVVLALSAFVFLQDRSFSAKYLATASDPAGFLRSHVPTGNCIVADSATLTLVADRFTPGTGSCPAVVDPYGLWLALDATHPPPNSTTVSAAVPAAWQGWLARANYLVEVSPRSTYLPWTDALVSWFSAHYQLVAGAPGLYVYARSGS
jgi:hypothetical protein